MLLPFVLNAAYFTWANSIRFYLQESKCSVNLDFSGFPEQSFLHSLDPLTTLLSDGRVELETVPHSSSAALYPEPQCNTELL